MNENVEQGVDVVELLQELGRALDGSVMGIVLLGGLFLAWVIVSRRRTRHLVELVAALRRAR